MDASRNENTADERRDAAAGMTTRKARNVQMNFDYAESFLESASNEDASRRCISQRAAAVAVGLWENRFFPFTDGARWLREGSHLGEARVRSWAILRSGVGQRVLPIQPSRSARAVRSFGLRLRAELTREFPAAAATRFPNSADHADAVRFGVSDKDRTVGIHKHAVGSIERAVQRIALRSVPARAVAGHE